MNIFFEEEGEELLRSDIKALGIAHMPPQREGGCQEERDTQGEVMPKKRGRPNFAHA